MLQWQDFKTVFQAKPDYAFDHRTVEAILKHRKDFGDQLFFDRIWKSIGLTRPSRNNYPPRSNQDLQNLWNKIVQSPTSDEHKVALLFYVLRDCRQLANADLVFARRTHLPPKYQLLVTGLWELDHAQFSRAVEYLTDPSLTPTFTDEILLALLRHPKCDPALAMAYKMAVSPPLKEPVALDAYFKLLVANNLVEAYDFAKRQGHPRHKALFETLVVAVHQEPPGPVRAEHAAALVGLALSPEEDAWFESCLLQGGGAKLPGATDSVLARRMATGHSTDDNGVLHSWKGEPLGGVTWGSIRTASADAVPATGS